MKSNVLREKSYAFALRTVNVHRYLTKERREFVLAKQFLRSGTSIGANVTESVYAESKADFIHKLSIALKEAVESEYWLNLMRDSGYLSKTQAESMLADCQGLIKMLTASVRTTRRSLGK